MKIPLNINKLAEEDDVKDSDRNWDYADKPPPYDGRKKKIKNFQ